MAVAAVKVGLGCPPVWKQGPAGGGGGPGGLGAGRPIKRAEGITHGQKLNFVLEFECCCCEHPLKLQEKKFCVLIGCSQQQHSHSSTEFSFCK